MPKKLILIAIIVLVITGLVFGILRFLQPKTNVVPKKVEEKKASAQEIAKKAGYAISWTGNKNDSTGRSLVADENRYTETIGYDYSALRYPEMNPKNPIKALGVVEAWEKIPNSKDYYLVLQNPQTKKTFRGRVTFENSSLNLINSGNNKQNIQTLFLVEDMNYGPASEKTWKNGYVSLVFETNRKELSQKAIKKGDVIALTTLFENMSGEQIVKKDKNGISVIRKVFIRRFGGASALLEELK